MTRGRPGPGRALVAGLAGALCAALAATGLTTVLEPGTLVPIVVTATIAQASATHPLGARSDGATAAVTRRPANVTSTAPAARPRRARATAVTVTT